MQESLIMKRLFAILFALFLICTANLLAAVPQQINYQGYLTDTGGNALDTTVAMTFKLYTDSTAGSLLWTETRPSVTVTDGLFNVRLGQITSLGDTVFNNAQVWLGVTVGNNSEMAPRSRIVSVGYSYRVGTVDGANGGTISGKVNIGQGNSNDGDYTFVAGAYNFADGDHSSVGGGRDNSAAGNFSLIAGGSENSASGPYSVVSGGEINVAEGRAATIAGGSDNYAPAFYATVGGGQYNSAADSFTVIAGGYGNQATNVGATVGGGAQNTANGIAYGYSTVSGGFGNTAGPYASVGGGEGNTAQYIFSTVSGGSNNQAIHNETTISGGYDNIASNIGATVGGGLHNRARGLYAVVAGGGGEEFPSDSNAASGDYSVIGGGRRNRASSTHATVGGGLANSATYPQSTVAGGVGNMATNNYATVSGGSSNRATGSCSTVPGGGYNYARGDYSVVSGGGGSSEADSNSAVGDRASIGGGGANTASGTYSIVPGGSDNRAGAWYSFAAGRRARVNASHTGAFVWSSTSSGSDSTASFAAFSFTARCAGGARFYTTQTGTATGVELSAGGGSWNNLCDVRQKRLHGDVNTADVLSKIAQLPLHRWSYKTQDESIQHIGPTAQDFYAAFHLGESDTTINTLDPDGIALAAIQELQKQNAELKSENEAIRAELSELKNLVKDLLTSHDRYEVRHATFTDTKRIENY
jgi:hypothetical protein